MGGARAERQTQIKPEAPQETQHLADVLEFKSPKPAKSREKKTSTDAVEEDFFARGEEISKDNKVAHRNILTEGKSKKELKKAEDKIAAQAKLEQIIDLLGDEDKIAEIQELHPVTKRTKEKNKAIRNAYKPRKKSSELKEAEWFNKGSQMSDRELPEASRWESVKGFLKKLFARNRESKKAEVLFKKPFMEPVVPAPSEKSREAPNIPMIDIVKLWNKDYARNGVRWRLDGLDTDSHGKNTVEPTVHAIANRLGQRVQNQIEKNGTYDSRAKSLVMAAAVEMARRAEKSHKFAQKNPEKQPKAA